jgi:hypothetical protein
MFQQRDMYVFFHIQSRIGYKLIQNNLKIYNEVFIMFCSIDDINGITFHIFGPYTWED